MCSPYLKIEWTYQSGHNHYNLQDKRHGYGVIEIGGSYISFMYTISNDCISYIIRVSIYVGIMSQCQNE